MDHSLLQNVIFYLIAAIVAVPLFRKLGLGAILGYLFAGALIGPQVLQLVHDPEHALHFAEFGVVMLLFVIGLELNPEKIWNMKLQIGVLGGGQLLGCAALIALPIYFFLPVTPAVALLLGLTLALSSTAFAVQLMHEQGILGSPLGRKGFSILLLQDMAVIPILLLVSFIAPAVESSHPTPWWQGPAAVTAVLIIGKYGLNPALRLVAESGTRELLTASALLIVLGTAYLMQASGLTMGMGAFLAGIILANSSFRHQLEADVEPFKGLLLGLFFIAVGMSLDLALLLEHPVQILLLALALMAVKALVIALLVRISGAPWRDGWLMGLMLSQGGEFAFVVMNKALSLNLLPTSTANQVILVVGISMALTSPLVMLFKWVAKPPQQAQRDYDREMDTTSEVVIAGFGRFGQIIGRILAANKLHFTALDKDAKHVDFLKQFGNKIYFGDATRLDLLEAAGIETARILVVAVDDMEDANRIVDCAQEHFPKLTIIARARNRAHTYQLQQRGVQAVVRETFESGLMAAQATLHALGVTDGAAKEMVDIFRRHDEQLIKRASHHQDDMEKLITIAAEGRQELQSLFQQDNPKFKAKSAEPQAVQD